MGVFYHPFKEKGNQAKTFLLNDTDDIIILTGQDGCEIYPMLEGTITDLTSNLIAIETETSGYSKQTKEKVIITYDHFLVNESIKKGDSISKTTSVGKLGKIGEEDSPYLTISIKSNSKSIDVESLYKKDANIVPKYKELREKGLLSYSTNTAHAANGNYAKLIFVQEPSLTTTYGINGTNLNGIIGLAAGELCDMIVNPYLYTGYSKDQLGATKPNKYQKFTKMGINVAWCVAFVTYCATKIGYVDNGLYPGSWHTSCSVVLSAFSNMGNPSKSSLQYTPVPGDLIFFNWSDSKSDGIDHIGIVYYVTSDYIYTIEGNSTREPAKFVDEVKLLGRLNASDPIYNTLKQVCEKNGGGDPSNWGSVYTSYVKKNYSDAGATFYSEFNGVTLRRYKISDTEIEEYIHME